MVTLHMSKVKKRLQIESVQARARYGWPKEITDEKYIDAVSQNLSL